jgi:hypothetical protein
MSSDIVGHIRIKNPSFKDPWKAIESGLPFEEVFPIKYSLTKEESGMLKMLHFFYPRHHPIAFGIALSITGLFCAIVLLLLSVVLLSLFFGLGNLPVFWLLALIPIFFIGFLIPLFVSTVFDWFVVHYRIIKIMKYVNKLTKLTGRGEKYYREMIQDLKNCDYPPTQIDIFTKSWLFRLL